RSVKKGRHVIGKQTLAEGERQAIRAASESGVNEPLQTREETKAIVHAMYGYASIDCSCGAKLRVPSTYNEPELRCIRCGRIHTTPEFVDNKKLAEQEKERQAQAAAAPPPAIMDYTRKSPGVWEGFPCHCGNTIQLS